MTILLQVSLGGAQGAGGAATVFSAGFFNRLLRDFLLGSAAVPRWLVVASLIFLSACSAKQEAANPLPALGANITHVTVSGLSSGGYMAGQYLVAHSQGVSGAGIVAAGPYGCALNEIAASAPISAIGVGANATQALQGCTSANLSSFGVLDPRKLADLASRLADQGKIDALNNLANAKIYLYSGKDDRKVDHKVVEAAYDFFADVGVPRSNIQFPQNAPGGHAFLVANQSGNDCGSSDSPYVAHCGIDQAGAILAYLGLIASGKGKAKAENYIIFDQAPFGDEKANLAPMGEAYIPSDCKNEAGCRVHVVFHGCQQSRQAVGEVFVRDTGFADWAEANRLILIFPQVSSSTVNPEGCWDWWGYTGREFLTRDAPQIKAVKAMIDAVGAPHA
jgi:poly(3-hydroxybutyrate) depolymerase